MSEPVDPAERPRPARGRESRSESFATRLTGDELRILSEAAKAEGKTLREWARELLLREAGHGIPDRAIFTELIALRQQVASLYAHVAGRETEEKLGASLRRSKHRTAREVLEQYTFLKGEE